jgi:hypothetical protein
VHGVESPQQFIRIMSAVDTNNSGRTNSATTGRLKKSLGRTLEIDHLYHVRENRSMYYYGNFDLGAESCRHHLAFFARAATF